MCLVSAWAITVSQYFYFSHMDRLFKIQTMRINKKIKEKRSNTSCLVECALISLVVMLHPADSFHFSTAETVTAAVATPASEKRDLQTLDFRWIMHSEASPIQPNKESNVNYSTDMLSTIIHQIKPVQKLSPSVANVFSYVGISPFAVSMSCCMFHDSGSLFPLFSCIKGNRKRPVIK